MRKPAPAIARKCQLVVALLFSTAGAAADNGLDSVLQKLDGTAKEFHTAQANFTWTVFNRVINDVAETESGKIYFRHLPNGTQMAADVTQPDSRQVVFSQG